MANDLERQPLLKQDNTDFHQRSSFLDDLNRSLEDAQQQSVERQEIDAIEMRFGLTPVRRMFCLLALFDFLFVFLLWIIYAQLFSDDLITRFRIEVEEYKFQQSLFDFVVLALIRCLCLLCVYALLKSSKWYMVAMTTMLTTLLAISKVFCIGKHIKTGQPLSYFIIITTFIICWAEAWHFDFQVIPSEIKARKDQLTSTLTGSLPTIAGPIRQWQQSAISEYQSCYSPNAVTPRGSDTSSNLDADSEYLSDEGSRIKKKSNLKKGKEAVHELLRMTYITENWQREKQEKDGVEVSGRLFKNIGKVFRCSASFDCPPDSLFQILWTNVESQPSWNPTVSDAKITKSINKRTDVCYFVAAAAAGGLVASRDFVNVRRYEKKGDMLLLAGTGTSSYDVPKNNGIVRGENGPGGYILKAVPGDPDKCEFIWFLNTNLKGWIPQKLIDQSMGQVMVDTVRALRQHIAAIP